MPIAKTMAMPMATARAKDEALGMVQLIVKAMAKAMATATANWPKKGSLARGNIIGMIPYLIYPVYYTLKIR